MARSDYTPPNFIDVPNPASPPVGAISFDAAHANAMAQAISGSAAVADMTSTGTATATALATAMDTARVARLQTAVALGTSITFGQGASTTAKRWANQFPTQVQAVLSSAPLPTVVNGGVSGDTQAQMLARIPALLAANKPGTVLIETSVNDTRLDLGISSATTIDNLRKTVGLVRQWGARPIVATTAPIDVGLWVNTNGATNYGHASAQQVKATNVLVRQAVAALGCELVDLESAFGSWRTNDLADGIHPNDTGHLAWATAWARGMNGADAGTVGTVPAAATTYVSDTFTRANSTTSVGGSWAAPYQGTWGITGSMAYNVSAADDDRVSIDSGQANHAAAALLFPGTAGNAYGGGLMTRVADGSNYYLVTLVVNTDKTGSAVLFKRVGGTYTSLRTASLTGMNLASTALTLSSNGSTQRVTVDGVPVIHYTDSSLTTGTRVGMRAQVAGGSSNTRWENFTASSVLQGVNS